MWGLPYNYLVYIRLPGNVYRFNLSQWTKLLFTFVNEVACRVAARRSVIFNYVMDIELLEERYLRITKKCAKLSGIWPEQSKTSKYIMRVISYIFVITSSITQIARIVCFFNLEVLIEQISFLGATLGVSLKQGNYIVYADKYKQLMEGIRKDWVTDRPKKESDILLKYAERGYLFVLIYMTAAFLCLALFLQMPWTPRILDIIAPKNESRDLGYVYPAYYAVDEYKYHAYIIAHMSAGISMLTYVYIACDTSFMYTVQHACGLLAIASYRFKTAIDELSNEKSEFRQEDAYRKMRHSIQGHQHALRYLKDIQDGHDTYFFIGAGMVMTCFTVTLFKVSRMDVCIELVKDYTFVIIQLIHVLYLTVQGQFVINSIDTITKSIYAALWYNSDKRTQLLFVLALRNCLSTPVLTAGGLITLNIQTFSEIVKVSFSYFTVLKSS